MKMVWRSNFVQLVPKAFKNENPLREKAIEKNLKKINDSLWGMTLSKIAHRVNFSVLRGELGYIFLYSVGLKYEKYSSNFDLETIYAINHRSVPWFR